MAETLTQSALANVAGQMPVRNKLIADQQRAARMLQLQQAVASMPSAAAPTKEQAAQMGATVAAEAGKGAVNRAQQLLESSAQLGKLGQAETALAGEKKLGAATEAARKESLDQTSRLAALDDAAKREVFDRQLQFSKNQANQTQFTERQLLDYARLNAQKDEDFKGWQQRAEQLHRRNIETLKVIDARLTQALQQDYLNKGQKLDQQSRREIAALKQENARRLREAQAKGANTAMMGQALGGLMAVGGTAAILATGGAAAPVAVPLILAGTAATSYGQAEGARQAGEV
jgi:hypothetical protein